MEAISHSDLIEHAAAWLRKKKAVVVITDMTACYTTETADVIGWTACGGSQLIEVKVSRSDFLADKHKPHRRTPGRGMGCGRYYCAPAGMISPEELPQGWGLLTWNGKKLTVVCKPVPQGPAWDHAGQRCEIALLITAMRRIGQNAPAGVSVKHYTMESKSRATLGTALLP